MFETVCTFPLASDLFAQAIHPSESIIAVGLASGHVQALRLPALGAGSSGASSTSSKDSGGNSFSSNGCGTIDTCWKTKRHKGSCRSLTFSPDGERLASAGSDGIVKIARTETGRVERKLAVPQERSNVPSAPSLLHILSPETLLVATDTSALHLYDFRAAGSPRPQQVYYPHDDYVSSLTPLPASEVSTSGFSKQWVTTGGTTVAVTDLRRGVLVKSEDQEEELLSSVYVGGLSKRGSSTGEKVLVGGAGGVVTLWERGVWDDQDERIVVDAGRGGGESLDTMALIPGGIGPGKEVVVGQGDGKLKVVKLGSNSIVAEYRHDEMEAVLGLGFEPEGRLVSGGGQILKVWQNAMEVEDKSDEDDSDDEDDEDDDGSDINDGAKAAKKRTTNDNDEHDTGSNEGSNDSDEGGKSEKKKSKKRKRGKSMKANGHGNKQNLAFKGLD